MFNLFKSSNSTNIAINNEMKRNHPVTFPLISQESKFFKEAIQSPISFSVPPIRYIAANEEFRFLTDTVVPNIMDSRYTISNYGRIYDCYRGVFLSCSFNNGNNQGYLKTKVAYYKDPYTLAAKDIYVHRAVMMTFCPIPGMENLEVDHRYGNKTDNSVWNLRWVTPDQNMKYAQEDGLLRVGEDHHDTIISNKEADAICRSLMRGVPVTKVANMYRVPKRLVYEIKEGRSFRNISRQYDFTKGDEIRKQFFHKPATVSSTLPDDKVHEICKRLERGDKIIDICRALNVGRYIVNDIKAKRNYVSISNQYNIPETRHPINEEDARKVCKCLESGMTPMQISKLLDISYDQVKSIRCGTTFTNISKEYNIGKPGDRFISDETAKQICDLLETRKYTCGQVGNMTYTNKSIVEGIYYRRSYRRISEDYTFWKK